MRPFRLLPAAAAVFGLVGVLGLSTAGAQNSPWYVGGNLGAAVSGGNYTGQVRAASPVPTPGYTFYTANRDGSGEFAGRLFGGYRLTPWLAVEVGYASLGSHQTQYQLAYRGTANPPYTVIGRHRIDGATADLVASFPLVGELSAHARAGLMATRLRYDETRDAVINGAVVPGAGAPFVAPTERAARFRWGFGASHPISRQADVLFDFEQVNGVGNRFAWTDTGNGRLRYSLISAGIRYRF